MAHFGWDDLIFMHLSCRMPGPEHHFLLKGQMLGGAAKLAWPGLVRLADEHHSGFRE